MPGIHFIGIGGVGMNGLAQLAVLSSYSVTGSDRAYDSNSEVFKALEHLDISIFPQDGSGISEETEQVVYSSAIESDNPDLLTAKERGLPLLHRAEFLKELIGNDDLIAVAGTAGKTTTTGLLGWIFDCMGKDPSVYNGAAVLNWREAPTLGNVRKGRSGLWIIEADESDKSFLNFHPTHTIITNISKDHYELNELHEMFNLFEEQTSGITVRGDTIDPFDLDVPMLGKHNLENARCAVQLCIHLGFDPEQVRNAVIRFKGIERRLEIAGSVNGITIIDDYAHNAAKIAAALSTAAETYGRVHAFWRPHGFAPLHQGLDDLADVFIHHWQNHGGTISILPVYYAGGTVQKKTTSADLVERINSAGVPAKLVTDYAALECELNNSTAPGDAILGMGARDPELPKFARRLVNP